MPGIDRAAFDGMLREEWRLHRRLFGGRRFAAFPLLIAALGAGAARLLVATGTDVGAVVAGLHALVFVFGLHTGSIGFVGRDAIRDLLGDVTLLVFSSRTLPVPPRRLLAVFFAKEVVYYAALFLLPLSLAPLAGAGLAFLPRLPALWVSSVATFVLGIAVTLVGVALSTRGVAGRLVAVAAGVALAGLWLAGVDLVALTPYGFYRRPAAATAAAGIGPIPPAVVLAVALYDPTRRRPARRAGDRFRAWRRRLRDPDGVATKSLLDVSRSSGGLLKVAFSGGVLFAVTAYLVRLVRAITGVEPSTGVSFGSLLGLTAFTTYNWLTGSDSIDGYLVYPVSVAAVFRGKFRAFLLLGLPTGLGYYALALGLLGGRPAEAAVGALLTVGVLLYLFGLTVRLAGLDPNEFLFDTVLFAAFAAAVSAGLVPVLIVGFVLAPLSPALVAATGAAGVALAAAGLLLYRRAIPVWEERYRRS